MKINPVRFFSEIIPESNLIIFMKNAKYMEFDKVMFWDGVVHERTLFLVKASELPEKLETEFKAVSIMCIADTEVPDFYKTDDRVRLVVVNSDISFAFLSNYVNERCSLDANIMILTNLAEMVRNGDLFDVIETIGYVLRGSLVLVDKSLIVLAEALRMTSENYSWENHLVNYYYPYNNITDELNKQKRLCAFDRKGHCLVPIDASDDECDVIFPILSNGEPDSSLGYIIFRRKEVPDLDRAQMILRYIAPILSQRLWKITNLFRAQYYKTNRVLCQILDGGLKTDQQIEFALRNIMFTQMPYNQIIVALSENGKPARNSEMLAKMLETSWQNYSVVTFEYNSAIVFIIRSKSVIDISEKELDKFEVLLKGNGYRAGIGERFSRIDHYFGHYFKRAVTAAVEGIHRKCGRYYMHCHEAIIFNLIWKADNIDGKVDYELVDPAVLKLMEYDVENDTEYLTTLRCYWHYNKRTDKICNFLHVQKSTLGYRLKKISKILSGETGEEIDIGDYKFFMSFSVSLAILEHYNKIEPFILPATVEE